jgi:hypothetical protein
VAVVAIYVVNDQRLPISGHPAGDAFVGRHARSLKRHTTASLDDLKDEFVRPLVEQQQRAGRGAHHLNRRCQNHLKQRLQVQLRTERTGQVLQHLENGELLKRGGALSVLLR